MGTQVSVPPSGSGPVGLMRLCRKQDMPLVLKQRKRRRCLGSVTVAQTDQVLFSKTGTGIQAKETKVPPMVRLTKEKGTEALRFQVKKLAIYFLFSDEKGK